MLNLVIFAYVISGVSVMLENSSDDQACLSQEIFVFIKDGLQKRNKLKNNLTLKFTQQSRCFLNVCLMSWKWGFWHNICCKGLESGSSAAPTATFSAMSFV